MNFRNATIEDLQAISAIEHICFPPNEAASQQSFTQRLTIFPQYFWLLEVEGRLAGYINGMVTDHSTIHDAMFEHAELHDENGAWQSVFGLAVSPEFRKSGYAGKLMQHLIKQATSQNRTGITLTCKEHLVGYYTKFGFEDLGISQSTHGGEKWHDMTLRLKSTGEK
ncbi:GNAT family N-acetyltransferase [Niabella hibiscisoli]|uniref:GNAT family N-acetyltransferase n=1 Tax=Niabella hibiscisoli TaxID=1825928 RepID=UPI001F108D84|nr:GNAT family N-acetyltransferase [Niabella hibiscisoli]MCH5715591.1 GNAT family N-acetyltransferase [Niabella hibiscisoli]